MRSWKMTKSVMNIDFANWEENKKHEPTTFIVQCSHIPVRNLPAADQSFSPFFSLKKQLENKYVQYFI